MAEEDIQVRGDSSATATRPGISQESYGRWTRLQLGDVGLAPGKRLAVIGRAKHLAFWRGLGAFSELGDLGTPGRLNIHMTKPAPGSLSAPLRHRSEGSIALSRSQNFAARLRDADPAAFSIPRLSSLCRPRLSVQRRKMGGGGIQPHNAIGLLSAGRMKAIEHAIAALPHPVMLRAADGIIHPIFRIIPPL